MNPQWARGDAGKQHPGLILEVIFILLYQDISPPLSANWGHEV